MTDPGGVDPRPLVGEPLALDLLNTRWFRGGSHDLLERPAGLRIWLTSAGFPTPTTGRLRTALYSPRATPSPR
ncbi:ABATE domain-containing protein [Nocardiopsis gilva]|uniref:ABATE domain-containing protein n=1 Tax=Nocardiopsis gilva TaxID=280236 RepID=UPI001E64BE69|nr:ABATE domain-containing protein [Nocardiopsis gilva]